MCDPLSAAAAALSVGGMVASKMGTDSQVSARNKVTSAEMDRQRSYQAQAGDQFSKTLGGFDPSTQTADLNKADANRTAAVNAAVTPTNPAVPVAGSAPTIVKSTIAKTMGDAMNYAKSQGIAQGKLQGYGDVNLGNNVNLAQGGLVQSRLGDFSNRSMAILPLELEDANRAGSGMRSFGSLLSGAGTLAGAGGALGLGPSWGDLFGGAGPMGAGAIIPPPWA